MSRATAGLLGLALVAGGGCLQDHRFVDGFPSDASGPDAVPPADGGFPFVQSAQLDDSVTGIGNDRAWEFPGQAVSANPYHEVFLSAYEIEGVVENDARYAWCVADGACAPPTDQELLANGGRLRANAEAFCAWLGAGWRIPTEAEWEHAARSGVFAPGMDGERLADAYDEDAYTVAGLPWANPLSTIASTDRTLRASNNFLRIPITDLAAVQYRCARTTLPQNTVPPAPVPPACVAGCNVVEIVAGRSHTCARRANQSVICWGDGTAGQLGAGTLYGAHVPRFAVATVTTAAALAAGDQHTCARITGGGVRCWGANTSGQLGDATTVNANVPVAPTGLPAAAALMAADVHSCALTVGGDVWCWGNDDSVGDLPVGGSTMPVLVNSVIGATMIAGGAAHTCVADATTVTCWGAVPIGGTSMNVSPAAAVTTTGFTGPIQELAAGNLHTCVRIRPAAQPDEVWCWGSIMAFVPGGTGVTDVPMQISDAATHVAAYDNGTAATDGTGAFVPVVPEFAPVPPVAVDGSVGIALSLYHTCAVGANVQCWGGNDSGQRGWGTIRSEIIPDVAVVTLP